MTRVAQNFDMIAGDTLNLNVTVYDENGVNKDIANSTIKWVLYDEATDTAVLTKTTSSDIAITNGLYGQFTVPLSPANTVSVAPGVYYHEAEVTDSSGNVSTVLIGHVTINPTRI